MMWFLSVLYSKNYMESYLRIAPQRCSIRNTLWKIYIESCWFAYMKVMHCINKFCQCEILCLKITYSLKDFIFRVLDVVVTPFDQFWPLSEVPLRLAWTLHKLCSSNLIHVSCQVLPTVIYSNVVLCACVALTPLRKKTSQKILQIILNILT